MTSKRTSWLLLGALAVGRSIPASAPDQATPAPVGNYHAHLVSEAAGRLLVPAPLPSVELPPDLARVLRDYERAIKASDGPALAALFTEDALFATRRGWIRGREAIQNAGRNEEGDLRIRAQAFTVHDSVGYIAGTVADGSKPSQSDLAKVVLTLRRGADGRWLIAARLGEDFPPPSPATGAPFTADQLIAQLDSAHIQRALVLSVAYWFGSPIMLGADRSLSLAEEYARVRAENDWAAEQAARYPQRLVAFCSFNPLKAYAMEEIDRCARSPGLKGIKLHLANSRVSLRKPEDVAQLRQVFRAANDHQLPVVVHMRTDGKTYGRQDAEIFVREILPEAPDIPIQIAHLAGWGGYDDATDQAVAVFVEAIAQRNPRTVHLYFDLTTILFPAQPPGTGQRVADRVRQIGLARALFGSDLSDPGKEWAQLRKLLPLSEAELTVIAGNVAPYLR